MSGGDSRALVGTPHISAGILSSSPVVLILGVACRDLAARLDRAGLSVELIGPRYLQAPQAPHVVNDFLSFAGRSSAIMTLSASVFALFVKPPASTFIRARDRGPRSDGRAPPKLRSAEFPEGLPTVLEKFPEEHQRVREENPTRLPCGCLGRRRTVPCSLDT